jgi:hypothetical protein
MPISCLANGAGVSTDLVSISLEVLAESISRFCCCQLRLSARCVEWLVAFGEMGMGGHAAGQVPFHMTMQHPVARIACLPLNQLLGIGLDVEGVLAGWVLEIEII